MATTKELMREDARKLVSNFCFVQNEELTESRQSELIDSVAYALEEAFVMGGQYVQQRMIEDLGKLLTIPSRVEKIERHLELEQERRAGEDW